MLLSDDVLLNVIRYVPRNWLDSILTANRHIARGIMSTSDIGDTNIGLGRRVTIKVRKPSGTSVDVELTAFVPRELGHVLHDSGVPTQRCLGLYQLYLALKDCVVESIEFYHMPHSTLAQLRAHAHRWQDARVFVNMQHFESLEHFDQFFDKLAVTTGSLSLSLGMQNLFDVDAQHLLALGAIRRCKGLAIWSMPQGVLFTCAQIVSWLHAPHESAAEKCLDVYVDALATDEIDLIETIKLDFEDATERCRFTVLIRLEFGSEWYGASWQDITLTNETTGERLCICNENDTIKVERCIP